MQVSSHDTISHKLAADVANAATFNVPTPAGKTGGLYAGEHRLGIPALGGDTYSVYGGKFLVAFSTPGFATVTNQFGSVLRGGTQIYLQLERPGVSGEVVQDPGIDRVRLSQDILVDIGQPAAALATGLATSQSVTAASPTGAVLVKTQMDVPRNVQAAWTGAAVCTVRGKDEFGAAMTESSASGTTFVGKKAFFTIDSIKFSANVTLMTAGWNNILGLPVFINKATDLVRVSTLTANDTTTQNAGIVVGDTATATATTGDVRGTYQPQATMAVNGTISYTAVFNAYDLYYRGRAQYAG